MTQQIKELRVQIDGLAQLTKELKSIDDYYIPEGEYPEDLRWRQINSKEIEKAVDSLYLAKAWLGKILEKNPYSSGKKTVEDIEHTADVNDEVVFGDSEGDLWRDKNHIEKVDWLRSKINECIFSVLQYTQVYQKNWIAIYALRCEQYLSEARFWLGFELGRVRNESR